MSIQNQKKEATRKIKHLIDVFRYSDSQPTEITLALVNLILAPIATFIELGPLLFYQFALIVSSIFQLYCIASADLKCRIRASFLTFSFFITTLMMYVFTIGLPTPSHWGWCVLSFSAFSSLKRLKTEDLHRS